MEKAEPTFVPEWLKNGGSLTTTSHQQSSSLQSDDQNASVPQRRKLLISSNDNNLGRATTSSYFRRTSSSNGSSRVRSYSSFGRRDWDKNKEKYENKYRDFDPLGGILPRRFEKDGLRRSQLNLSAKRGESWPRKVIGEKTNHNNGKMSFERDFPSLGLEEKQVDYEIGRVPSPGLSSVIQNLPVGGSGVIGGDAWTSALAEVPVMVGTNGPTSISVTTNVACGRNMAETLAHGPPRAQTASQLSGTQRLEELAVKQSRQLIPMTPSMPKALAMNAIDKPKLKMGQLHLQTSHTVSHLPSTRHMSMNADVTKLSSSSSTIGKLHVLKLSRERNASTIAKESSSPTAGGRLPDCPLAERKPCVSTTLEKKPSPQAKSRNDFFNLMRKKSMANNSSNPVRVASHESTEDKPSESKTKGGALQPLGENKAELCNDNDACITPEKFTKKGNNHLSNDVILYSEEEEARFLRSLGWEETTEEEGLTEEEINSFYRDYVNLKTASSFFKGTQLKSLMPLNLLMGKNGDFSADTKVDS
ncbi:hypothetical protein R6Q59_016122 [Mikania micrantha]|uniref:Uncharacterized protein n=1 Tax=Mikania micrantha TaxID=192012 RepID=A0A5N6PJ11_9ASTR|nr:hypothetical protein E3N88_09084 [Mikania micrantha]